MADPTQTPTAKRIDKTLSAWLAAHIHNSPVSRVPEAFHHLLLVLEHLKAELLKEV